MKITTVIRLLFRVPGTTYNSWPGKCGLENHDRHCICKVPANWVFTHDVHDIWREQQRYY